MHNHARLLVLPISFILSGPTIFQWFLRNFSFNFYLLLGSEMALFYGLFLLAIVEEVLDGGREEVWFFNATTANPED